VNSLNGVALRARALATEEANMLWTIAIVLLALWALGLVTSFTMGGFIHLLIVAAVILVVVRLIQGRAVV
jgi:FtsH-binding integral membrane protein